MSKYSIIDNSASKPQPAAVLPDDDAPADWWVELQNLPVQASGNRPDYTLTGRRLGRLVRKSTAIADRVLLALRLEQEGLHRLTRAQAARLVGVSVSYVGTASRLSVEEQGQLAHGLLLLSHLHNRRRRNLSDAALDRLVVEIGAERMMAALDRYTQPSFPAE